MHTILQISDLHRSTLDEINNDTLLSSILADSDRYIGESPPIPTPSAIVVSGDLVHGVVPNEENWRETMDMQYCVASQFIEALCDHFLDGDRSLVAIIPGNHDVCWNTSSQALVKVDPSEYPCDLRAALIAPDGEYRWSWKELALYRIVDPEKYGMRLDAYWNCIEKFYTGVSLPLPFCRERGYNFFEFFDRRAIVAAFESTWGNDNLRYYAAIKPGTVGRCAISLRDLGRDYDIRMAVWHHSLSGGPAKEDYLDICTVHEMVGQGFQLGFHGHQHLAETSMHTINRIGGQTMAVVSAGSLCAGWTDLPRGVNRQYNLVTIEDDFSQGRIHVREMIEGSHFTRKSNGYFSEGHAELFWSEQTNAVGLKIDAFKKNLKRLINAVEHASKRGELATEITELLELRPSNGTFGSKVLLEALLLHEMWTEIIGAYAAPKGAFEEMGVINAHLSLGDLEAAERQLEKSQLPLADKGEINEKIQLKKLMAEPS